MNKKQPLEGDRLSLYQRILDLFFPPKCPFCGKILSYFQEECQDCTLATTTVQEQYFWTEQEMICYAPFWYRGSVRDAFRRYKFLGARHYAPIFGRYMAETLGQEPYFDCITWVPLSRKRQWTRGYNQSELLARVLAEEMGCVPLNLLVKIKDNQAQSSLNSDHERLENTQGVYRLKDPSVSLAQQRILLVDDVVTTGASLRASAEKLLEAGAVEVRCVTLARSR